MIPFLLAALVSLTLGCQIVQPPDSSRVTLEFLDVGQGDAILIRSPEGRTALVDAGPASILHKLETLDVDSIAIAIASHPHADHIGGMAEVIRSIPVSFYMDNGMPHTTRTYRDLLETLEHSTVTYLQATRRKLKLGSVTIHVLPPPDTGSINNRSIGLLVEFGKFTAILTGDSEVEELNYFLKLGIPRATVLKAAHHGARNGLTPAWLAAVRPQVVIVPVGAGNRYGHPSRWAMAYYSAVAKELYRTDTDGDIVVRGWKDGRYEVVTEGR